MNMDVREAATALSPQRISLVTIDAVVAARLGETRVQGNTQPAFSPDGERIAFRSSRDGGGIFLMGATGESVL